MLHKQRTCIRESSPAEQQVSALHNNSHVWAASSPKELGNLYCIMTFGSEQLLHENWKSLWHRNHGKPRKTSYCHPATAVQLVEGTPPLKEQKGIFRRLRYLKLSWQESDCSFLYQKERKPCSTQTKELNIKSLSNFCFAHPYSRSDIYIKRKCTWYMVCVSVGLIIWGRGRLLPPAPCGEAVIHQPAMIHKSRRHFQELTGCPCLPWAQGMQLEWERYRTWKSCQWAWWRGMGGSAGPGGGPYKPV